MKMTNHIPKPPTVLMYSQHAITTIGVCFSGQMRLIVVDFNITGEEATG